MKKIDGKLTSALGELGGLWAKGNYRKALRLAAGWPRLGSHRNPIKSGWGAASNPRFYKGLHKDPEALVAAGLAAVAERYNLPPVPKGTTL